MLLFRILGRDLHTREVDSLFCLVVEHDQKNLPFRVQAHAIVASEDRPDQDLGEPAPGRIPAPSRGHGHGQSPRPAELDQDLVPQASGVCLKKKNVEHGHDAAMRIARRRD